MIWLNFVKQIVQMLQSEISPKQIAAGAALGMILGFAPVKCLQSYVLLIIILLVNVNLGSATLSTAVFALFAFIFDPIADKIGYYLLVTTKSLTPFWTNLYNMPLLPYTKFYNTVVLGSFVISIILIIPVYLVALKSIGYYRANYKDKVAKWKIMKLFSLTSAANIYDKYQQ
jgi:uncharacterized protein (TIGR03546 family)